jgi:hypothetical protein
VRDQLTQCIAGATALGPDWPSHAPTVAEMTTARNALTAAITDADTKEAAWKTSAGTKRDSSDTCRELVLRVDDVTTGLYTETGVEKNNFGIPPEGTPDEPLHQLIEIELRDGPVPGSLEGDWESIEGASYEINWATVPTFATLVGSATSASASQYIISGLIPGTQYWMRVRPLRGGQTEAWSDPATRVAPV